MRFSLLLPYCIGWDHYHNRCSCFFFLSLGWMCLIFDLGMLVRLCKLSTQEAEAGGEGACGYLRNIARFWLNKTKTYVEQLAIRDTAAVFTVSVCPYQSKSIPLFLRSRDFIFWQVFKTMNGCISSLNVFWTYWIVR